MNHTVFNQNNSDYNTLITVAKRSNFNELHKLLKKQNSEILSYSDPNHIEEFDLFYYCKDNKYIVEYLLSIDTNYILINKIYKNGQSVIEFLIKLNMENYIIKNFNLINNEVLSLITDKGKNLVLLSIKYSCYELAKLLIENGLSIYKYTDDGKNIIDYLTFSINQKKYNFLLWLFSNKFKKQVYGDFHYFLDNEI